MSVYVEELPSTLTSTFYIGGPFPPIQTPHVQGRFRQAHQSVLFMLIKKNLNKNQPEIYSSKGSGVIRFRILFYFALKKLRYRGRGGKRVSILTMNVLGVKTVF